MGVGEMYYGFGLLKTLLSVFKLILAGSVGGSRGLNVVEEDMEPLSSFSSR